MEQAPASSGIWYHRHLGALLRLRGQQGFLAWAVQAAMQVTDGRQYACGKEGRLESGLRLLELEELPKLRFRGLEREEEMWTWSSLLCPLPVLCTVSLYND